MISLLISVLISGPLAMREDYQVQKDIPYCTVGGLTQTLNAFLPTKTKEPVPAIVEIHGGWFMGGGPQDQVWGEARRLNIAEFSINYRLGDQGGFPECIRDCRNAIRFIRKNAQQFNIDPNRIACGGGSAGGFLSLMVAMVPENFDDGGPVPELKGISAKVCGSFSWIPVTDLIEFWNQGPDDKVVQNGQVSYRPIRDIVPNDARPHLRSLFHGVAPDSPEHVALYRRMSPLGHVSRQVPPLLICDGEKDPIVPGLEGKQLYQQLKAKGSDATYWMSPGGHDFPSGPGFDEVLHRYLLKIFRLPAGS